MTVNLRETMANGNKLVLWGQDHTTDATARRVAAALPRNADHVRHVEADYGTRACIWYERPEDAPCRAVRHYPPEGWRVLKFDHFRDGTVALVVEPEGAQ